LKQDTTVSFHVSSSSSHTQYFTIRRYIINADEKTVFK